MNDEELKSYKPYARFITLFSAIIVIIAGLDASKIIELFPAYANQINTILILAGLIAPAIAQEKRIVRAEELKDQEYEQEEISADDLIDDIDDIDDDISYTIDDELIEDGA